jgi:hypothetical protein
MKEIHLLVHNKPGNQHNFPEIVLATNKAFKTKNLAIAYKEKGGDPKEVLETVETAEILTIKLVTSY